MQRAAAADYLLDLVGPDAGGVDDHPGPDRELAAVLEVPRADADHPLALAQEPVTFTRVATLRAVRGGGAGDGEHQPGVVDLAVEYRIAPVIDSGLKSGAIRATPLRDRCRCRGRPT